MSFHILKLLHDSFIFIIINYIFVNVRKFKI